jgi:hypothetical protein
LLREYINERYPTLKSFKLLLDYEFHYDNCTAFKIDEIKEKPKPKPR